jgi:GT2 family glycosyltransferase/2-polyprenyl-3-methyl-5-hydroxy-6-metoxy-1,4-benzoquinol methylase
MPHQYSRSLEEASGESLRQLAAWIRPGSLVLELGPASGYFTRFLREQLACTVDAVELDPDMAAKAAGWCRRMVVGNLEQIDFAASFADQRYDFVVVADVLEHLADPAQLLRRLSGVLRDDGELLVSVPNVAYAGLVASLLQGEFSYREEGLLDRTHLRFFTRASLQGLLAEAGFHVWEWRAVDRSLMDSEFRVRAETLAPALRSELLSQPNALCYQWLARVRSTPPVESPALPVSMTDAFPVRVFWAVDEEPFDFDRSVVGWGKVGEDPQTVSVALPASAGHLRVRLSDRPGYLHLFGCRVVGAEGSALFAWQPPEDVQHLVTASDGVGMHQDPACPDRISMLLHGDESWLDLAWRDVPAGACIEFSLGWPMSPDYLQASRGWIAEVGRAREQVEAVKQLVAERDALLSLRTRQMHQLEVRIHEQEQVAASQMQMLKKSQLTVDRAQDDGSRPVAGGGARGDGEAARTVDIIVPIYNAVGDLRLCIDSVLAYTAQPYRLVLIDDASPDPAVKEYLATLAAEGFQGVILENEKNLGFVGTCNRAMALSGDADVVLLNSDTLVTPGWLEALRRCIASDARIGTATPWSNNAEICSFPAFCQNTPIGDLPPPEVIAGAVARASLGHHPELPTGVGFCFYITRALLNRIGLFDQVTFGRGYGEENDLCMRARKAGFRNVLCDDAFVVHTGGSSFTDKKLSLMEQNLHKLVTKHPDYPVLVRTFIERDVLRPQRELIRSELRMATHGHEPGVLHVVHHHGGGTELHVRDLIAASPGGIRHYLVTVEGNAWHLEDFALGGVVRYRFDRLHDEPWAAMLNSICHAFRISLCHVHHLSGARDGLLAALAALDVPYGITLHDGYLACPTITLMTAGGSYCGGQTEAPRCQECLNAQTLYRGIDIGEWRAQHAKLLSRARFVLAPSRWLAATMQTYFPGIKVDVVPHGLHGKLSPPSTPEAPQVLLLPRDERIAIGVIGAIGPVKGARRLERLVARTRERRLPIRWVLVGYLDTCYQARQDRDGYLTIHGPYKQDQLGVLLDHYGIRLVVFPSSGPESFSYTLSESWYHGRPAIVPPFGALAERVEATGAGWVMDDWLDDDALLDHVVALASPAGEHELQQRVARARQVAMQTPEDMAAATEAHYRAVHATSSAPSGKPMSQERRYRALCAEDAPAERSLRARLARRAWRYLLHYGIRLRHTRMGHWLYRRTPPRLQRSIKQRLISS